MKAIKRAFVCLLLLFSFNSFGQNNSARINFSETAFLKLQRESFNPKGKKIEYLDGNIIQAINGKPVFGTDGKLPKFQLTKASLTIGNIVYNLDISDIYNPWFGEDVNDKAFKLKELGSNQYKLYATFSDGAGGYGVEWLIKGKASIRTILSDDEVILYEYFEDKMK